MNLTRRSSVLAEYGTTFGKMYIHWCPGCKCNHSIDSRIDGRRPNWEFNGNMECPTFSPSINYYDRVCHYHITNGTIIFGNDCTHELRGQSIPLEKLELD